jgi:hypothetical protein
LVITRAPSTLGSLQALSWSNVGQLALLAPPAARTPGAARLHGVQDPAEVRRAYLEPNGMISVIRRDGAETDTPEPPPG